MGGFDNAPGSDEPEPEDIRNLRALWQLVRGAMMDRDADMDDEAKDSIEADDDDQFLAEEDDDDNLEGELDEMMAQLAAEDLIEEHETIGRCKPTKKKLC